MDKKEKAPNSRILLLAVFILAAVLFCIGGVGMAMAEFTSYSDTYVTRVEMKKIGVSLMENGSVIASRDYSDAGDGTWVTTGGTLLENMLGEGEALKRGVKYPEVLVVKNSGNIDEYVRVKIHKYWIDAKGNKLTTLSTDLIELELITDDKWVIDDASTTAERTILYYSEILKPGDKTDPFCKSVKINDIIATKVTEKVVKEGDYLVTTTTYDYDGITFIVEVEVDAVQTHNAEDAVLSAWGVEVSADGETLALAD